MSNPRASAWLASTAGSAPGELGMVTPTPGQVRNSDKEAVRAAWEPVFGDPHSHFEIEEVFAADHRVVQRWRYSWGGGHVRGVDLVRFRDGKIAEKLSYVKG
jgi:hypothetical protein